MPKDLSSLGEGDTYVTYCLLRCVDEVRDEALNVGVLALDPSANRLELRVTSDLRRVAQALPNVPLEHLRTYLASLPGYFADHARRRPVTTETLFDLAATWGNGVRLSALRSVACTRWEDVLDSLFARFVDTSTSHVGAPLVDEVPVIAQQPSVTSRRLVRRVISRLRGRGFREHVDLQRDAEVVGVTRGETRVPVWFPLMVTQQLLVDTMEVREWDPPRSVDGARLLAAKANEVLRASDELAVSYVVANSGDKPLDSTVASILLDEGRADGRIPTLYWAAQIDDLAAAAPRAQLSMPFDANLRPPYHAGARTRVPRGRLGGDA
jgi:hypothetical protein